MEQGHAEFKQDASNSILLSYDLRTSCKCVRSHTQVFTLGLFTIYIPCKILLRLIPRDDK